MIIMMVPATAGGIKMDENGTEWSSNSQKNRSGVEEGVKLRFEFKLESEWGRVRIRMKVGMKVGVSHRFDIRREVPSRRGINLR